MENRHITSGEIKHLFVLADMNKDNLISSTEWNDFRINFVVLYEASGRAEDYRIDKAGLDLMLEDEIFKGITVRKEGHEELSAYLFNVLDTEKTGFINFADYMFLRKTNLAWKKCAMDDQISRKNMGCAMTVAVPGRRLYLPDSTELFDMGVLLFKGTPVMDTPYLNFQAFFEISRVYYYFQEFNLPFDNGLL